jgi:hypothetical protein
VSDAREQELLALENPPRTPLARLLSRAEEWIYELNAREHPIFRLYDAGNALWARLAFRGARRRLRKFEARVHTKGGREAVMRWIPPDRDWELAELFEHFDFPYLPPHPLDRAAVRRVLEAPHCIALGIYGPQGQLFGYSLIRLFFPRRAVMGMWIHSNAHTRGLGQICSYATTRLTNSEGLPNFITIPRDNVASLRAVLWSGWRILRTNRRFHVLLHDGRSAPPPGATLECRFADGRVLREQGPAEG